MRIVVMALSVFFAAVGFAFWMAPEETAQLFQLEATGVGGLVTLRADLGGAFLGLALVCLTGEMARQAAVLRAAAVILAAIALGRLVGFVAGGSSASQYASLAIEVVAIAVLVARARQIQAVTVPAAGSARRILTIAAVIVAIGIVVIAALLNPRVEMYLFEQAAKRLTGPSNSGLLADDALRVAIAGSSAPLASARRAKACVAVFAGGKFYVVDVGPESVENLVLWGLPMSKIGGAMLTHFHSDHIGDLGELQLQTWAGGRPGPLPVYGGPGVEQVVDGFNLAYRHDQGYRTEHHTERWMPSATWGMTAHLVVLDGPETDALSRTGLVFDDGTLKVTAIEVDHTPIRPAYAYRFDYKGRSVVITGDLKKHPPLAAAARGADILISEAIARPMVEALQNASTTNGNERTATIMHDIQDYHISPLEAAEIANEAGVKLLAFFHLLPAPDQFLTRRLFGQSISGVRRGDWVLAEDGSLYTLPVGSQEVRIGRVDR
jgi:ribonuclease Z